MLGKHCSVLMQINKAGPHQLENQVVLYLVHILLSQHHVMNKRLQPLCEPVWSAPVFAPAPRPQGSPSTYPWLILSQILGCHHQPHWKQQFHIAVSVLTCYKSVLQMVGQPDMVKTGAAESPAAGFCTKSCQTVRLSDYVSEIVGSVIPAHGKL